MLVFRPNEWLSAKQAGSEFPHDERRESIRLHGRVDEVIE
jgi:hypothetical protein